MFVEIVDGEKPDETCARCIKTYFEYANTTVFDYSRCLHCPITQSIHQEDSQTWNGYCRFLR